MTTPPTTGTLRVPGATLHYETRGQGPALLLIPGGTGAASAFDGVADLLAADHTVIAYDPRGFSRSPLDAPATDQQVAVHADDAYRLLEHLSPTSPAKVFGSSSGAIVALHLLTTHPDRVTQVIAHEPPLVELLPDAPVHRAFLQNLRDTYDTQGLQPAMTVFATGLSRPAPGSTATPTRPTPKATAAPTDPTLETTAAQARLTPEPTAAQARPTPATREAQQPPTLSPEAAARIERTMSNMPFFLRRIVPTFMSYTPDLDRLAALSDRLTLAAGEDSPGELTYRPAAWLAAHLGTDLLHFPGGHVGLTTHPTEFATLLHKTLT
ncbi:alpha/beta fold hydrolase [Nonomuraea sp. NPDC050328]|uniref:alpha/beta fold hydrolase n=1 Tax=Nonomuraea sp. NPDC050328 TaxID=3364361 RepID=UPI0037A1B07B